MKSKYIKISLLAVLAVICCILAWIIPVLTAHADDGVTLEGQGDNFLLSETVYGKTDNFVYTATANFESGNAAGLVFGADENQKWVFNVDRAENRVKLMYFYNDGETQKVEVLKEEYYVGSSIMNEGEQAYVKSRTANIDKVYLKVAVNSDGTAEFYADGIQRFVFTDGSKPADTIDISGFTLEDGTPIQYDGGLLGYNCFNARVNFTDTLIGNTDYGYYGELYRNQYHFSQFAHWNNDPNGMVYYNGYYHLYFQHNPYGNTWDAMHWGHARSTDLAHWELLPIALVPDRDLSMDGNVDHGIGAMWSGSARVYHKGDSAVIDSRDWFDMTDKQDGDSLGLIGFYTRFDDRGNRHQIVMYSTDGGLTWNKRDNIPSDVSLDLNGNPVTGGSWRDPKVFDISDVTGNTTDYKWGMVLTNMEGNTMYFLKSKDLINWEHAGCYEVYRPECPDLVTLTADDGETHTVITFTSRYYVVCDLAYEDGKIVMKDMSGNKINRLMQGDPQLRIMDYGVDSYACQTFYIDSNSDSKYAGKSVAVSWFSGVPNDDKSIESGVLQTARKVWNGGGVTIPVVYGLQKSGAEYTLTTTPITAGNESDFTKTSLNGLDKINGHSFEISATVQNDAKEPVYFRINGSEDGTHYTEIGWNKTDGYYVDRTHTEDAGINFPLPNYACKYVSGMGKTNTVLDFYILSDNGGVEVYCDGFTVPFYILTFASPYSVKATFTADHTANATITVNEIASVWRKESDETLINLSETQVNLGTELSCSQNITAYAQGKEIAWEIIEGEDCIEVKPTSTSATVIAKKAGSARIKVTAGTSSRMIYVTVHNGKVDSNLTFKTEGIVSGQWYYSGDTLVAKQAGGDGFILSEDGADNFTYSANFSLSGAAAAIVFRAKADMSDYLIANYDNNGKIVKLWSPRGELGRASVEGIDVSNITLKVKAKDNNIIVYINGNEVINVMLAETEPAEGLFGLNTCAASTTFKSVVLLTESYTYSGGNLSVMGDTNQAITALYNRTLGNVKINPSFYTVNGRTLEISQSYFQTLKTTGVYKFTAAGAKDSFDFSVNVTQIPSTVISNVTIESGCNAVIYVGNITVSSVTVNGTALDGYSVKDGMLIISGKNLSLGENAVKINDTDITVTVIAQPTANTNSDGTNLALIISLSVVGGVLVLGGAAVTTVLLLRRKKKNGGND